jgi:hypothetical protein
MIPPIFVGILVWLDRCPNFPVCKSCISQVLTGRWMDFE